ncbi:maltose alpha-D-glucosyltransferase [Bradyrhizobium sp. LHD-71]|uniref:maltose alpha-D-glucosyltransferase n=1 Tax=Bradyrhizobium sp. LHD-71 TaxID=3072141 RepID=UPI00280E3F46|nr:maltose alpha-D-glucosyltransferase [Bradyrhizobium sp. LHD-71]MDQ8727704.1 maltose alpha-D-glucosyltransferase [Bradyrhizobium sp. LHD-71]
MNRLETIDTAQFADTDELWYKDAIIYQLHVKAFADSNNDGIGDFAGLTEKLDYLHELGVTAIWLLPFYPSPGRDDGYDIADYGSINPDFGTMKEFRRFITEAKRRNLRVITELVVNHTSDQHPWFRRARRSPPGSSARDWYVWSDTDKRYTGTRIIFTDTEKSNWTWDAEAKAYYWHRFFAHQPDLNFDNPRVVSAVVQVMKRWLDSGVDGFRLDAIPYLCEREGTSNENLPETHAVIKQLRAELDAYAKGKVLLAEANQWPEDVQYYFGDGDECHMAYHFPLMPRIYMAIAQEDRFPIVDILRQTPDIPGNCQWAMFLRNHDELTLEMVTDIERDYLWSTYAADPRARINLGIRRRLAPLMDNDRRKMELMNSLLMSFPGTPIIYYGDEIGMGDNIYLGDRNGVRTPMQWSPDRNGGFSRCDPARLYAPPVMDAVYGYESINVESQSRSLSSLLNWTKKLIAVRKSSRAFGRGTMTFVRSSNHAVLAYLRIDENEVILCVANLSRASQASELDLTQWKGRSPFEMLGRTTFPDIGDLPYLVTLGPYGFYWFELKEKPVSPNVAPVIVPDFQTLVIPAGATFTTLSRTKAVFERDVLPSFLSHARWFPERSARAISTHVATVVPLSSEPQSRPWLVLFDAKLHGESERFAMPVRIVWDRLDRRHFNPKALAAVRQGAKEGTLIDVATDTRFIATLLSDLRKSAVLQEGDYRIHFKPTERLQTIEEAQIENVRAVEAEQSNSTALVDDRYVVKIYRKLEDGLNPEADVGRFLTDVAGFSNTPALLGSIELKGPDIECAVAIVHAFVENQGDAWTLTGTALDRFVEGESFVGTADTTPASDEKAAYQRYMTHTGRRVAEMQIALASRDDIEDFRPRAATQEEISRWIEGILSRASRAFARLENTRVSQADALLVEELLKHRQTLRDRLAALLPQPEQILNIRHHGDFHLGQMLIVKDDIFIIDFEGEPRRTLAERRMKAPAARDVAGLIRSIDYSVSAALERSLKVKADEHGQLQAALADWREASVQSFLTAYRATLTDARLWPQDPATADNVLQFFLLEKAFYEIEYELAHRPDWLKVALSGALRVLGEGRLA